MQKLPCSRQKHPVQSVRQRILLGIFWDLIVWEEVTLHVASTLTQTAPWIIYDISRRVEKVGCVHVKSGSVMLGAGRVSHGCGMGVGRVSDGCRIGVG